MLVEIEVELRYGLVSQGKEKGMKPSKSESHVGIDRPFYCSIVILLDIMTKLREAIAELDTVDPQKLHEQIPAVYNWHDVAERTEHVYTAISQEVGF